MTNEEFSNMFTTLLNSYNTQAQFGEQASKREIVLDEYEKSVLLTQAQDIIVKSYFDRTLNNQGQGFDDSTRRQVDFSSLIKVDTLQTASGTTTQTVTTAGTNNFNWTDATNRNLGKVTVTNKTSNILTLNINCSTSLTNTSVSATYSSNVLTITINVDELLGTISDTVTPTFTTFINRILNFSTTGGDRIGTLIDLDVTGDSGELPTSATTTVVSNLSVPTATTNTVTTSTDAFDSRGLIYKLPTKTVGTEEVPDVLFILNEKMTIGSKTYVVVPISYLEYDREMSKPYAQPLKKQAWRLFQNQGTGFDMYSELIPNVNLAGSTIEYKIRYVRRPRPIVLEDMPNDLTVDGESNETSCELNPILHIDILNKAVELAITTRGIGTAPASDDRQRTRE